LWPALAALEGDDQWFFQDWMKKDRRDFIPFGYNQTWEKSKHWDRPFDVETGLLVFQCSLKNYQKEIETFHIVAKSLCSEVSWYEVDGENHTSPTFFDFTSGYVGHDLMKAYQWLTRYRKITTLAWHPEKKLVPRVKKWPVFYIDRHHDEYESEIFKDGKLISRTDFNYKLCYRIGEFNVYIENTSFLSGVDKYASRIEDPQISDFNDFMHLCVEGIDPFDHIDMREIRSLLYERPYLAETLHSLSKRFLKDEVMASYCMEILKEWESS
ncbi:MAG: hypothetical protein AAGM67_00295, partial [Bacteroidota bacterium]